ncbi:basic proline-rich protein-like [Anser cygnoides]|uniref:basic proline-rich protein-like n=1 Tax=Anser cygnoides TaxID=8845 RepID=UPI0034D2F2C7
MRGAGPSPSPPPPGPPAGPSGPRLSLPAEPRAPAARPGEAKRKKKEAPCVCSAAPPAGRRAPGWQRRGKERRGRARRRERSGAERRQGRAAESGWVPPAEGAVPARRAPAGFCPARCRPPVAGTPAGAERSGARRSRRQEPGAAPPPPGPNAPLPARQRSGGAPGPGRPLEGGLAVPPEGAPLPAPPSRAGQVWPAPRPGTGDRGSGTGGGEAPRSSRTGGGPRSAPAVPERRLRCAPRGRRRAAERSALPAARAGDSRGAQPPLRAVSWCQPQERSQPPPAGQLRVGSALRPPWRPGGGRKARQEVKAALPAPLGGERSPETRGSARQLAARGALSGSPSGQGQRSAPGAVSLPRRRTWPGCPHAAQLPCLHLQGFSGIRSCDKLATF